MTDKDQNENITGTPVHSFFPTQEDVRDNPALLQEIFIAGPEHFRDEYLHEGSPFWDSLKKGQKPLAYIIKCVDSRYPTSVVLALPPGMVLTHESVGALCYPFDEKKAQPDSVWVSLEFAVKKLGVPVVIGKGHSGCGCAQEVFNLHVKTKTSKDKSDPSATLISPLQKWIYGALPLAESTIGNDYLEVPQAQLIRRLEEAMNRQLIKTITEAVQRMIDLGILSPEQKPTIMGYLFEMETATMYKLENGNYTLPYTPQPLSGPHREDGRKRKLTGSPEHGKS